MEVKEISAKVLTTLGIGGKQKVAFPRDLKELKSLARNEEIYLIGGGSNLVLSEENRKILVSLKHFKTFKLERETLTVGAGVEIRKIIKEQIKKGFSLFETLAGIRAKVGGLIAQNAGAYGFSVKERLLEVKFLNFKTGEVELLRNFEEFSYRKSPFPSLGIILEATFKVERDPLIKEKVKKFIKERLTKHPPFYLRTAGSTFKNPLPPLPPAGKLLELSGLKGKRLKELGFSEVHSNFLINYGSGTFREFQEITELAVEKVKEKFGVNLELEVKVVE